MDGGGSLVLCDRSWKVYKGKPFTKKNSSASCGSLKETNRTDSELCDFCNICKKKSGRKTEEKQKTTKEAEHIFVHVINCE